LTRVTQRSTLAAMGTTSKSHRFVLVVALLLGHTLGLGPAAAEQGKARSTDETAIRAMMAAQADAWNRGDAAAWSKDFAQDADFVNIFGMVFSGRKEIEERHAGIFASIFKGSQSAVTVRRVVFLTPRLAIVDSDHVVTGYGALPPTLHPVDGAVRTRMKYVMRKGPKGWVIVAAQNTEMKPLPARQPAAPERAKTTP
jgi:uncharacterized protein (TIGR02246 family)